MIHLTKITETFPSVHIPNQTGGLPIEVSLIGQLGHGAGNHLFAHVVSRQRGHANFADGLDEPSVKLAGTNFSLGDTTSLYSFVVGPKGHPFHCHAGHRIFTAVSGSGGAQLRFSTATHEQIKENPHKFIEALHFINIPPDCLFTVRFGGETWHQFWPLSPNSLHPVFFALSCHTDELGGNLSEELKNKIIANEANIHTLTELLPPEISNLIQSKDFQKEIIPTTILSLDAPAGTMQRKVCDTFRGSMGILRGTWGEWYGANGYISKIEPNKAIQALDYIPENLLLRKHLINEKLYHEDAFLLSITAKNFEGYKASQILEMILEGFLLNSPKGVSKLMMLRNILVKPLGLRTSPLGCPVSSLLSDDTSNLFANQYPVIDQSINDSDTLAQVILGADDKHLRFRSLVGVEIASDNIIITLANRVHTNNIFGKFYMSVISYVHRNYIAPTMLKRAADYAFSSIASKSKFNCMSQQIPA